MTFTAQEKDRIVSKFIRYQSVTRTQRWVRTNMRREPPSRNSILRWHYYFMEHRNLAHRGGNGRPRTSAETVTQVRTLFENQPRLSIRQAASTLEVSTATVHRILKNCLFLYPYKLQNFHGLLDGDKIKRLQFAQHC